MEAADPQPPSRFDQAGAVPFRRHEGQLEFCLITSTRAGRWQFPKGFIDPGETPDETALKEALEEAGVHGRIVGEPLGYYQYAKWGGTHSVLVLLMEVTQCDEHWFEDDMRQRRWVTAEQAGRLLSRPALRELLDVAVGRLGSDADDSDALQ